MTREPVEMQIFGPPGTGKTSFVSRQVSAAAEKYGSDGVMVASFTRTAAAELAGRNMPLERQQVGTLHSHCYRALRHPAVTAKLIDEWNREAPPYWALSGGAVDLDEPEIETKRETGGAGDAVSAEYHRRRAVMAPRPWTDHVEAFARAWEAWKADVAAIDFTDMIELCLLDVEKAPGDPAVAFFDEVQDFVPLQLALIRKWAASMDYVVLAGDDDQALYSWIGATPDAWLSAEIPEDRKRVLAQSYRVPAAVHAAASRWVSQIKARRPKEYQPRVDGDGVVVDGELRTLPATWKTPEGAIDDAGRYLDEGKTVMFLASCSYMLVPLLKALRERGLPFQNEYRRRRGDWNPLAVSRGVSAAERLLAYLRPDRTVWGEESRFWNPEDLRRWIDVLEAKGTLRRGAKTALEGVGTAAELSVEDLFKWFEADVAMDAIDLSLDWFESRMTGGGAKKMAFPLAVARARGGAVLRERPRITVGTIHSVKGGEKDVCYLFPDLSLKGYDQWLGGGAGQDAVVRQFYVGMTRARESLIVCDSAGFGLNGLAG